MKALIVCLVVWHANIIIVVVVIAIVDSSSASHHVALHVGLRLSTCTTSRLNGPLTAVGIGSPIIIIIEKTSALVVTCVLTSVIPNVVGNANGSASVHDFFVVRVRDGAAARARVKRIVTVNQRIVLLSRLG